LGITLSAVYTLGMIRSVFFGESNAVTSRSITLSVQERLVLIVIVVLIVIFGIYPQPMLDVTAGYADQLYRQIDISYLFRKF
jgi:NADH-quinone oxidoreductase subunit M